MTSQEELYFSALSKDRRENAEFLDKPSMRGVQKSVVEKYSDQAHFIYELLQNADDAKATEARFVLHKNELIFAHNGSRHFSISNPMTEDADSRNGMLGDINAITSIANSNKLSTSTIGKFGVGFKAVFQYTSTPHIYDPNFCFRIEKFIVPVLLNIDHPDRKPEETLFVFPFDNGQRSVSDSYSDIADKLRKLSYPILFLTHLKNISFEIGSVIGLYGKECENEICYNDGTKAELICLTQNKGSEFVDERVWLFSRDCDTPGRYSVGYFMDKEESLIPVKKPAFCFFPTKESTGLNFMIHAPFLLTDSREGIHAGNDHNKQMMRLLAKLSADSLLKMTQITTSSGKRLIDDRIIDIIPIDENEAEFTDEDDREKISFKPFYDAILDAFKTLEILPTNSGYTIAQSAYWASTTKIAELFTDEMLREETNDGKASWVFRTIGRESLQSKNKTLSHYIDQITYTWVDEDSILEGKTIGRYPNRYQIIKPISKEFIENQTKEWISSLYLWLSETENRTEKSKTIPIFLDEDNNATAAFNDNDEPLIFLPTEGIQGCATINSFFLTNERIVKFLDKVGVEKASLKDEIYNYILPKFEKEEDVDDEQVLRLFYGFYKTSTNRECQEFLEKIKDYRFIYCKYLNDDDIYLSSPSNTYYPTDELKNFLFAVPDILFADIDSMLDVVGVDNKEDFEKFLSSVGVRKKVSIEQHEIDEEEAKKHYNGSKFSYCHVDRKWIEPTIDGLLHALDSIVEKKDCELSVLVMDYLVSLYEKSSYAWSWNNSFLKARYQYRPDWRYNPISETYDSVLLQSLKNSKWIYTKNGSFCNPSQIHINELAEDYCQEKDSFCSLISYLGVLPEENTEPSNPIAEDEYLSDEQKEEIALGRKAKEAGLTADDIDSLIAEKKRKQLENSHLSTIDNSGATKNDFSIDGSISEAQSDDFSLDAEIDNLFDTETNEHYQDSTQKDKQYHPIDKDTKRIIKEIANKTKKKPEYSFDNDSEEDEFDADGFTSTLPVDYSARIERAKDKSAREIEKIAFLERLQNKAINAKKYSFEWFNAMLEMESICASDNKSSKEEISISFGWVGREQDTERTLVLKHPNRYIPQSLEDLADIPLTLYTGIDKHTLVIEVVNVKSYSLRAKLKSKQNLEGIDFSCITEARIDVMNPTFLLEELKKQFSALPFQPDYDLQQNLCENIEFIFGPPGTGKTTYLAKDVLIPLMETTTSGNCRVLVLTPTNKAADVLVQRIIEGMGSDKSYEDWLVRFGSTYNESIENSPIYKEKTFDIRALERSVTVTTIARFPYDYFMPNNERLFIRDLNWDYIVLDEASMIPLANIVYPLYKKSPTKFVIAGDPFQIEPITAIEQWKDENIYSFVRLKSFDNPTTEPHPFKVVSLKTQYRSIPVVGEIFSSFSYGGVLRHARNESDQKRLNLEGILDLRTLNTVKFPVSKYESIYKPKKLKNTSSYHIYAALFCFEFVSALVQRFEERNPNEKFSIGIIAPYRAQADLIDKLFATMPSSQSVEIQVGTIHGFQGDECDMILGIFNPPPSISASREMFLNKKNIINVAISRARDYLVLLIPDDATEGIEKLNCVNRVEALMKNQNGKYKEYSSKDLEKLLWNDEDYIENSSFSTSHQNVNVYGLPEKKYEVRSENDAIDVQIHRDFVKQQKQELDSINSKTESVSFDDKGSVSLSNLSKTPEKTIIKMDKKTLTPYTQFYWLNKKTKQCPGDGEFLSSRTIPVKKRDGSCKKLNMLVCPSCQRNYLIKGAVSNTINLEDYCIQGHEI